MTARLLCVAAVLAALVALSSALTVHLVPHTHDDVGWLKTVDQYYIGSHQDIQDAGVQYVLTSVIAALKRVPERKFIYVEQAFFQRWWRQQNDAMKADVQKLVKNGQLEFINGGWCMHDEAAAHYIDMIDQTTLGHLFIREQFGEEHIPTVGWQIDPFGHSATQAALLSAAVGFDGLFFGRIDYQDRTNRLLKKELEMVWSASPSYGPSNYVFAGAMDGYGPPSGLCWDETCGDDPIQNDPRLEDVNSEEITEKIVRAALSQAAGTRGDLDTMNIMWTMGSDFNYENAEQWFINLDKAIQLANANGTVKLIYSTPSQYIKAKNAEPVQWTTKYDDFFPYSDGRDGYWTGYFTSRPALKGYVRTSSSFLQVVRHFEVFSGADGSGSEMFWEALSVAQHHDGVSGTAKQAVTFDYAQRISVGAAAADQFLEPAIARIVSTTGKADANFSYCPLANVSVCDPTNTAGTIAAVIYNPQARALSVSDFVGAIVRIPVYSGSYSVYDASSALIANQQVVPVMPTQAQPEGAAAYEVVINTDIAGLGIQTVFLQPGSDEPVAQAEKKEAVAPAADTTIENEFYVLTFDNATGLISSITTKQDGVVHPFVQDFAYYPSYQQDNQQDSGAYIFRPAMQGSVPLTTAASPAKITNVISGPVVQQVWQQVSEWVVQKITLYQGRPAIEFEWTVGPVPVDDKQGKEVIIRFNSSVASNGTWYTDSNGREFQQRIRNFRPTWNWAPTQPIAGNYYPVNAVQWLADSTNALVVLNDRSQGGASMQDGSLEFMVHRRMLKDDGRGVDEALNEPGLDGKGLIITGRHFVSLVAAEQGTEVARVGQNLLYNEAHVSYTPVSSIAAYTKTHQTNLTFLATDLPLNVELITAQVRPNGDTLIRLAHQFGAGESDVWSQPATVDLAALFNEGVGSVTELSLSAAYPAGSHKTYAWNTTDGGVGKRGKQYRDGRADNGKLLDTTVTLQPMEIRTFSVSF